MGTNRPARGLGLGLAVARAIVDAHGGELRLESAEGQGTTARVRLPLADGTA
jgi:signal transduction histidine kinase